MKWLLVSCVLICFSIDTVLVYAESEKILYSKDCEEQVVNYVDLELSCKSAARNGSQIDPDFQSALQQYSIDDSAIHRFAAKYCPIYSQLLKCSLLLDDVDAECFHPFAAAGNKQEYVIDKAIFDYMCANNGSVLTRFVTNNGWDSLNQNNITNECFNLMFIMPRIDEETLGPSTELCVGIGKAFECYADYVRDHVNSNLAEIGIELGTVISRAVNCTTGNEL